MLTNQLFRLILYGVECGVAFYMAPCDDEMLQIIVKNNNDDVILHVFCVFKNGYFNNFNDFYEFYNLFSSFP